MIELKEAEVNKSEKLRELIRARAVLLQKIKKAKGKKLEAYNSELDEIQRNIALLDEKQG